MPGAAATRCTGDEVGSGVGCRVGGGVDGGGVGAFDGGGDGGGVGAFDGGGEGGGDGGGVGVFVGLGDGGDVGVGSGVGFFVGLDAAVQKIGFGEGWVVGAFTISCPRHHNGRNRMRCILNPRKKELEVVEASTHLRRRLSRSSLGRTLSKFRRL